MESCVYSHGASGILGKIRVLLCSSRTYDLPITSPDALPLSYMRLVGAKTRRYSEKIRVRPCRIPTYDLTIINADALPFTCRGTTISRVSQSSFEMTVASITRLQLLRLAIGLKISRQFINQWEGNPKPIATCTRDFFCALSNCDWTK